MITYNWYFGPQLCNLVRASSIYFKPLQKTRMKHDVPPVIKRETCDNAQTSGRQHVGSFFYSLPILDTLQKMTNYLLVNVDIPIDIKRLKDESIHLRLT